MDIRDFMKDRTVILDGATGTELYKYTDKKVRRSEEMNLADPHAVYSVNRSYFDAGSDVVLTNTFGVTPLLYDPGTLEKMISSAVSSAKKARDDNGEDRPKFIALDIGPTGKLIGRYGELDFDGAVRAFSEVVRIGASHGADLIMIETMSDSYEAKAALLAAKECCDLPVFVSCAYGENGRMMTGAAPQAVIPMLEGMGADAVGVNCSFGPEQSAAVIKEYLEYASVPVLLKPNAGLPRQINGMSVYDTLPDVFASRVAACIAEGVRISGGCCGTTPAHIKELAGYVKNISPAALTDKGVCCVSSHRKTVCFSKDPVLIGEKINPTGNKKVGQALLDRDYDTIVDIALDQADAGARIIDVNVSQPGVDEAEAMKDAVTELQTVTDLPLAVDTPSPAVMESGLRYYNGCPLVNSVNGRKTSMDRIFPLVKKYGGTVVALTLDENGIPDTAEGRFEIASKILLYAKGYGIGKNRIIFDPLVLAACVYPDGDKVTLESVRLITERLGCRTLLGISNISYGLPDRAEKNREFLKRSLDAGVSAVIADPCGEGISDLME